MATVQWDAHKVDGVNGHHAEDAVAHRSDQAEIERLRALIEAAHERSESARQRLAARTALHRDALRVEVDNARAALGAVEREHVAQREQLQADIEAEIARIEGER